MRVSILGNAGAGKSTLARRLAEECALPYREVDRILWRPDFQLAPRTEYLRDHAAWLAEDAWIIDGVGTLPTIEARLERATHVVLIDPPLWQNFWLAAERQISWARGAHDHAPGGYGQMPPTRTLFELIWTVEREWMPAIRTAVDTAQRRGCRVTRIADVDRSADFRL